MADDGAILAKIEFGIIRYRNGKGSFAALVNALDTASLRVSTDAGFKHELRSRWLDLDEIRRAAGNGPRSEPQGEQRRQAEMVLEELVELARANR